MRRLIAQERNARARVNLLPSRQRMER